MAAAQKHAQKNSWTDTVFAVLKEVVTLAVCGYVIYAADVVGVMMRSQRIYRNVLNVSLAAYAVFFLIWAYVIVFVQRRNPNWENTHMHLVFAATGSVTVGGILWVVALWPVFHIWTIPLGLAGLFFFLSALALLPSTKSKAE